MRDLNSLYSEILVMNTIRERRRRACQWDLLSEATAERPTLRQRLASVLRALRPVAPVTIVERTALAEPDCGTVS